MLATSSTFRSSYPLKMSTNPTDDEKTQFANAALEQLNDPTMVQKFQDNVKQVGTWANEVDAAFGNVTRKFATMVETYGKDFPDFVKFNSEWVSYNSVKNFHYFFRSPRRSKWTCFQRWVTLLTTSRDVASQHAAVLRRERRFPFISHNAEQMHRF